MTADIEQRFAAVEERLAAAESDVAEHAKKVDNVFKLLGGWLDQQPKQAMDPQVKFINARTSQRTQEPARPVQSAEAFDGAVDRINNKRKELLGAKK